MFLTDGVPDAATYDVIVIGSGPAGLTVAVTLGRAGRKVLVLESGGVGEVRSELANAIGYGHFSGGYWNGHTVRAFGGTSAVWAGWCSTFNAIDFDNPAVGVSWPIGRAELSPYYAGAAEILDQHPAYVEFEKPFIPGFLYKPFSIGPATRFSEKYADEVRASAHIHVALHSSAVGFGANSARSAVTRVDCYHHPTRSGRHLAIREGQSVVAACGGLGNAQLLLQPRSDGGVPVGNERGQAGLYLMEHPHFDRAAECVIDEEIDRYWPEGHTVAGAHTVVATADLMREHGLVGCSLQWFEKTADHPLARHLSASHGRTFYHYSLGARVEMRPSASNHVWLFPEQDASGLYRVAARCVIDSSDLINVELTVRALGIAVMSDNKGRVRVNNDRIYHDPSGGGHIMGTTRMGRDPATSVVDADGRVHGYDNFFIAGSSAFPTGSYANPTFTIVSLALRLADTLNARALR